LSFTPEFFEEELEQELNLQAKRRIHRLDTAQLGEDMRRFLTGPLGQAMWKAAKRDQMEAGLALMELRADDPNFIEQFRTIQARAVGGDNFILYCAQLLEDGDAAFKTIQIEEGKHG
jgi:hypothetical protein